MSANNVVLEHASLWVQIWRVPFNMMSPSVVREVGNKMGMVENVERRRRMVEQILFLRVRVALPISKPLRRGGFLLELDGKHHWVISMKGCRCSAITVGFSVMISIIARRISQRRRWKNLLITNMEIG